MITLLLVVIMIALVTLLSVQNATPVPLSLLYLKFEVSLAIIIVLTAASGVLTGAIAASNFKKKVPAKQRPIPGQEKVVSDKNSTT